MQPVQKDKQVALALREFKESQGQMVTPELMELKGHKVSQGQMVTPELMELKVLLVLKGKQEIRGQLEVLQVQPGRLVSQGQLGLQGEELVQLVQLVVSEIKGHKESQEL